MKPSILVVHLPAFRLERCGWSADELVCLTAEWKSATRLAALTPRAIELGLRHGMSASEARAREPDVLLEPLDEAGERIDRLALAESLRHFSDRVSLLWEDDYALDISRTAHLFGGEQGVVEQIEARLRDFGHACTTAVAGDLLSAAALARSKPLGGADEPSGPPALPDLSIAALRPTEELLLALATIGVERIGQLAELDAASVAGRFGREGVRLHRVARGEVFHEWLETCEETHPIRVPVQLGGAIVRLEPLLFALRGAIAQVCEELFRRDQLAIRLAIRLALESGAVQLLRIRVGRPTRNAGTLLRVLTARLEGLQLDAPTTDLAVEVEEASADSGTQPSLHDRTEASEALPDLVARLTDALGEECIVEPVLVDSWRPEGAWRDGAVDTSRAPPNRPSTMKIDPVERQWRHQAHLCSPRPTLVLPHPRAIEVRAVDGRPQQAHVVQGWQSVHEATGPERLQGEWWADDRGFDRDYWAIRLRQGTAWVFQEQGRWFLHGWFD